MKTYGLLLDRLGIGKKVVTLGGAAVELVKGQAKATESNCTSFSEATKRRSSRSRI